jgi:hypothetical protein
MFRVGVNILISLSLTLNSSSSSYIKAAIGIFLIIPPQF